MTTFVHTLIDFTPPARADGQPWTAARIEGTATIDGTPLEVQTVTLDPVDADPGDPQPRDFTVLAPFAGGYFQVTFIDAGANEADPSSLVLSPAATPEENFAFATTAEVASRRGLVFTDAQTATASLLLQSASSAIIEAARKDEAWAAALDPVPPRLRHLCIDLAARAMGNPDSARSLSEQLGAYQHSVSFRDTGGGVELSTTEERMVRQVVYGTAFRSVTLESPYSGPAADDLPELPA